MQILQLFEIQLYFHHSTSNSDRMKKKIQV